MIRFIKLMIFLAALGAGAWWLWENQGTALKQYVSNSEIMTLEARYTPEQIMESHRSELLGKGQKTFQNATTKYYPYLLMDVKYIHSDKKPREGTILWGLHDGEMVLNTENWEQSHGFEDAIVAGANANDFRILFILSKNRGGMTREQLGKELKVEDDTAGEWIESARLKHLISQKGNEIFLHFEDPKIPLLPQTKMGEWFVSKPYNHSQHIGNKYSKSQIERTAKIAFGSDFKIRNTSEVYLPVYSIEVANPDGSTLISLWNALTGQRLPARSP